MAKYPTNFVTNLFTAADDADCGIQGVGRQAERRAIRQYHGVANIPPSREWLPVELRRNGNGKCMEESELPEPKKLIIQGVTSSFTSTICEMKVEWYEGDRGGYSFLNRYSFLKS